MHATFWVPILCQGPVCPIASPGHDQELPQLDLCPHSPRGKIRRSTVAVLTGVPWFWAPLATLGRAEEVPAYRQGDGATAQEHHSQRQRAQGWLTPGCSDPACWSEPQPREWPLIPEEGRLPELAPYSLPRVRWTHFSLVWAPGSSWGFPCIHSMSL